MGAAKKFKDKKVLQDLVPINALSANHLDEISRKAVIDELRPGRYLFSEGDRDHQSIYLIEGVIEFVDGARQVVATISSGTEESRHPLAHKQPRQVSARAATPVTIARIDSDLLDVLLTWDESAGYDVVEIDAEQNEDWMTRVLQSKAFLQLPPSNLQQLLLRLEEIDLAAGETVVRQGEMGEFFYIVKAGRLSVSRKASSRSREVVVAELSEGASFGEEALLSETARNASVTMVTDGTLMRLSKDDFHELLCVRMVREVAISEAQQLVGKGARWLDVRLPGEHENQSIRGSFNLPLSALRDHCPELDDDVAYVVFCDTGRRSAAAAFLLGQRGYTVYALKNGLGTVPDEMLVSGTQELDGTQAAEILDFAADQNEPRKHNESRESKPVPGVQRNAESSQSVQRLEETFRQLGDVQEKLKQAESKCTEHEAASARSVEQIRSLEKQLRQALKDRKTYEQQLRQIRKNLSDVEVKLAEANESRVSVSREHKERVEQLENELSAVRKQNADLSRQNGSLQTERNAAASQSQQLQGALAELEKQRADADSQRAEDEKELRQSLEELCKALDQEREQGRVQKQQLEELQAEGSGLEAKLREALGRERELDEQLRKAEERAQQAGESARRDAAGTADALNQRINELLREIESRQAIEEEQRRELETSRQRLEELELVEHESQSVQQQLLEANRQSEMLSQQLDQANERHGEREREAEELRHKFEQARSEYESDISSVRDALSRAQDERENVKRDQKRLMDTLRKTEQQIERERQDHEAELRRVRKERDETAGRSESGQAEQLSALQQELAESAKQRDELRLTLGERSAQVEALRSEIEALTEDLKLAREGAEEADRKVLDAKRAADSDLSSRVAAEQEVQAALRADLEASVREREQLRQKLDVVSQEAGELRATVEAVRTEAAQNAEAAAHLGSLQDKLERAEGERDHAREMERKLVEQLNELRAAAELQQSAPETTGGEPEGVISAESGSIEESDANEREQIVILQAEVDRLHSELDGLREQVSSENAQDSVVAETQNEPIAAENQSGFRAPLQAHAVDGASNERPGPAVRASVGRIAKFGAVALAIFAVGLFAWLKSPSVLEPALDIAEDVVSETIALVEKGASPALEGHESGDPSTDSDTSDDPPDNPEAVQSTGSVAATAQPESVATAGADESDTRTARDAERASEPVQPGKTFRDRLAGGGKGPTMVELHADTFRMGSGGTSQNFDERPRHDVAIGRFAISRYEITFEQYDAFAKATGRARPRGSSRATRPVANVSWADARAYAEWLSEQTGHKYRLPTEAEWEFAARSGTITRYWWGNQVGKAQANCFDCEARWSGRETAPVGSFAASPFGLHDMAGNVREWVQDCYVGNYKAAPTDGDAVEAPNCAQRVIRGGSYSRPSASLRVTSRDQDEMDTRLDDLGFRLARDF